MAMHERRYFYPVGRYEFDFKLCPAIQGWAQIDTSQDASYFGAWVNPMTLRVVTYAEGDVVDRRFDFDWELVEELRSIKRWNDEMGYEMAIDPCEWEEGIVKRRLVKMGVGDLLH